MPHLSSAFVRCGWPAIVFAGAAACSEDHTAQFPPGMTSSLRDASADGKASTVTSPSMPSGQDGGSKGVQDGTASGAGADTTSGGTTVGCDETHPCAAPLVCVRQACISGCRSDADCGQGEVCGSGVCSKRECNDVSECQDLMKTVCDHGRCVATPCHTRSFVFDPKSTTYKSVHVAGTLNKKTDGNWPGSVVEGGWELTYLAKRNVWYLNHAVPFGEHLYKLVLDGSQWVPDPGNPDAIDDSFGGKNSRIIIDCNAPEVCGDVASFDWRDAIMYSVMVDRFVDSDGSAGQREARDGPYDGYAGGDIRGLTSKLSYLRDLGMSAIWMSSPASNRSGGYHGYWPSPDNIQYQGSAAPSPRPAVNPQFGDEASLHEFIDQAHAMQSALGSGIKVVFDHVMKHVNIDSGLYRAHNDWFVHRDGKIVECVPDPKHPASNLWDDPYWGTRCAFNGFLPPFDFYKQEAIAWTIDDAIWWAKNYHIDGYRLDAIKHVPSGWLTNLRQRVRQAIPNPPGNRFYLVGETFSYDNAQELKNLIEPETMLDGQLDFPTKARLCDAIFRPEGKLEWFSEWMKYRDEFYGPKAIMATWIGNQDVPRPIHSATGELPNCREVSTKENGWNGNFRQPQEATPYERLALAFAVMMTNPGIPVVYYGDEIGLAGGGDPDNRRLMPWSDGGINKHQRELRARIATLSQIRSKNKALTRGRRITQSASQDTWVYTMVGCGADSPNVTVAINRADGSRPVTIPPGTYVDLITTNPATGGPADMPARSYRLLRSQ